MWINIVCGLSRLLPFHLQTPSMPINQDKVNINRSCVIYLTAMTATASWRLIPWNTVPFVQGPSYAQKSSWRLGRKVGSMLPCTTTHGQVGSGGCTWRSCWLMIHVSDKWWQKVKRWWSRLHGAWCIYIVCDLSMTSAVITKTVAGISKKHISHCLLHPLHSYDPSVCYPHLVN